VTNVASEKSQTTPKRGPEIDETSETLKLTTGIDLIE
jgi:hypothetical protein